MHPLALDEKRVCNTTDLRICWKRTVIGVLFHNVVMREWWSKNNKGQRVETRGEHSGINMSSNRPAAGTESVTTSTAVSDYPRRRPSRSTSRGYIVFCPVSCYLSYLRVVGVCLPGSPELRRLHPRLSHQFVP